MVHDRGYRVLRHRDRLPTPWANGGGTTYEVARHPTGDGDFDWRLSVAEIATEGPFSSFPGIDRVLILLSGSMKLDIDGATYVVPPFAPLAFTGEAHVESILPAGPTMDLNVMTRRGRVRADIEIVTRPAATVAPGPDNDLAVVVLAGSWGGDHDVDVIGPCDCVMTGSALSLTQQSTGPGALACITLAPQSHGGARNSRQER